MLFNKLLRARVIDGEITCSVRIWKSPRVKVGRRYSLTTPTASGFVEIDRISEISLDDITPNMARECGFSGVVEMLKIAKHGVGERVFYIEFHYIPSEKQTDCC